MNKILCSCLICKNQITTNNLLVHYNSKLCQSGKLFKDTRVGERSLKCTFCNRIGSTNNSIVQHELYCRYNPNKREKKPSYGMLGKKMSEHTKEKLRKVNLTRVLSDDSIERIREANRNRVWTDESRKKLSDKMKIAVQNNPESYSKGNSGKVKLIEYNGIKFNGNWEVDFYKWCITHSISVMRNTKGFSYIWNGERTYFPDFYLPDYECYVEVKGYKTDRDNAKWIQFPEELKLVLKEDIIRIRNNDFSIQILMENNPKF